MRTYTRAYEQLLVDFRTEKDRNEEVNYSGVAQITVATLISRGENSNHIANILAVSNDTVVSWYRTLILNEGDLAFNIENFSYFRKENKVKADARTIGCVLKAINDGIFTKEEAAEAIGLETTTRVVNGWFDKYENDYEVMITMRAGQELVIHTAYATNRTDAEIMQATIFEHDRVENELSSQMKEVDRARRA